jgi:uncharacterized protein YuzE
MCFVLVSSSPSPTPSSIPNAKDVGTNDIGDDCYIDINCDGAIIIIK